MSQLLSELFTGTLYTCYRQFHVMSAEIQDLQPETARQGHVNGLCGGAVAGGLFLTMGIHTGSIPITVELHGAAPALDDAWEEIVEASCAFGEGPIYLHGWAGESSAQLAMPPGAYRARFCASAFGRTEDLPEDDESDERYLLIFWPAAAAPDAILKCTSGKAAWWHKEAANERAATPDNPALLHTYPIADVSPEQLAALAPVKIPASASTPTPPWRPSLETWGLPFYRSRHPDHQDKLGPLMVGRVFGKEVIAAHTAAGRVLAQDVCAMAPVPARALAACAGNAVNSSDTLAATARKPFRLGVPVLTGGCLASGADEPLLGARENQSVYPCTPLLQGADAVLDITSPYFKGELVRDKTSHKIIGPVPAGTNVIAAGADLAGAEPLLYDGRRLSPGDVAALCMAGVSEVTVYARPRVAVCMLDKYFQPPEARAKPGANSMPDAISPMVVALLSRWGVQVDTVRHIDAHGLFVSEADTRQVNAVSAEHDLTIMLGFLGDDGEHTAVSSNKNLPLLQEPEVDMNWLDWNYSRHRGQVRPADTTGVGLAHDWWNGQRREDHCNLLVSVRGMPLSVLTAMYTVVRPLLDALSGVGAYTVANTANFIFGSPIAASMYGDDKYAQYFSRPHPGQSRRHGVQWLTGVLGAPAPRDAGRHWLQLARIERGPLGETMLHVLPSEEYQVSGMIGADAMVGITKGEGEMAAGSVVEYFLLD